ncbi:hypothetical protein Q3G72_005451 [Acer saccharum]|nr:hypothetical protein Q3G72_005451 [Acer saccharum]
MSDFGVNEVSDETYRFRSPYQFKIVSYCIGSFLVLKYYVTNELEQDPWTTNYGVQESFSSLAAIESQSHTLQDFSSFLGSSSPQQRVDFSSSQLYQSQAESEDLAFCESLRKQQTNMEVPERQHSQLSPLWLRLDEELQLLVLNKLEANMEAPQRQHIQPSQEQLSVNEPQLKQTSMKPLRSYYSHVHLNFNKHPLEVFTKFVGIFNFTDRKPTSEEIPSHPPSTCLVTATATAAIPLSPNEDKAVGKSMVDEREASQNTHPVPSLSTGNFPGRASYQGKEKETSSSTYVQSLMPATNEPLDRESSGNQGRPNILSPTHPEQENRHEIPSPISDITLNTGMENKIVLNAKSDVNRALQACSPPGPDIHRPHGEMDKPLFDIPIYSGKIDSSTLSAPVIDLDPEPSAHDREAPTSGMDDEKPRKRGPYKGKRKPRGPRKQ